MLDLKFCYKQQDTDFTAKSIQRSDSKLCIRAFKFKCACFTVLFSTAINSYQCICCSACTLKHAVMHASCDDAFTKLYSEMSLHACGTARSKTVHFSPQSCQSRFISVLFMDQNQNNCKTTSACCVLVHLTTSCRIESFSIDTIKEMPFSEVLHFCHSNTGMQRINIPAILD